MLAPSQTIYVKNLNEKIRKTELRKALYSLFIPYGPIIDVVAQKTQRARGQAFIVFRDVVSATNAMRELQNFICFEKPLVIQFARSKSDAVARADGTYVPRAKTDEASKKRKAEAPADGERPLKRQDVRAPAREVLPPNKTLFVQNLPEEATEGMITSLFQQFPGFVGVRTAGKRGIAFVDFINEMQSSVALTELQGFKVSSEHSLVISFQKRIQ